ncbi:MAG: L,D-transpeptidase [Dehalococcoidia bacterium]
MKRAACVVAICVSAIFALLAIACGSGDASTRGGVTVEPIASRTAPIPLGGKPAAPAPSPTPEQPDPPTIAPEPVAPQMTSSTPAQPPTSTPAPAGPPRAGRWIDVDVTNFVVRTMDGEAVVQEFGQVAVGEQVDTGAYLSTQTGLFAVHAKTEGLAYDAPFDTYISHWIGFDPAKDNGFHSLLKDAGGAVVDASTGRVSNGCIRVPGVEALFAFAELGMPVYVHL